MGSDDSTTRPVTWTAGGLTISTRPGFSQAARDALRLLRSQLGHDLWMVTRVDGDDAVILDCLDHAYGLRSGAVLPWSATLDWPMTQCEGPRVAPRVADVPAYVTAGLMSAMRIGSYAGAPLEHEGRLFGTLTGLHPAALPDSVTAGLPLIETLASMLSTVLALEVTSSQVVRRAERAELEAHVDPLTQLGNRLAWTKTLIDEENRCLRYGHAACVISVDLDGLKRANDTLGHDAGDRLLRDTAVVLRRVTRMCDQVARVGGDEFAVLAVEASEIEGRALLDRIAMAFGNAGIDASVGMAVREAGSSLEEAWKAADAAMYRHKRRRLQERVSAALAAPAPEVAPRIVHQLDPTVSEQPVATAR